MGDGADSAGEAAMEFVSEAIEPEKGSFTTEAMSRGLAALPGAFRWRGRRHVIAACLERRKRSAREGHTADGELYLRREEFTVRLDSGRIAVLYVLRQPPAGSGRRGARRRWFLYAISAGSGDGPGPPDASSAAGGGA